MIFPFVTILIMLPIGLCILGPIGTVLGNGLAVAITALNNFAGPVATAIIASSWPLIIATGMHHTLSTIGVTAIAALGFDDNILVGAAISSFPLFAIALSYTIKSKKVENRSYGISSLISHAVGGVSEPIVFGILFRYKKSIISLLLGGFIGGLYAGFMNVACYFLPSSNFFCFLSFSGENSNSLIHGMIACAIAFIVSLIASTFLGFGKDLEDTK